jgi:SAM-dependent methyltransferase
MRLYERAVLYLRRTPKPKSFSKVHDKLVDIGFGVRTGGIVETSIPDGCHASALPYWMIALAFDNLALTPQDLFLDIGCGVGRAVCLAARWPIELVMGIDASELMCDLAENNLRQMRGRACREWDIKQAWAQDFDYREVTVCYLFNPFGPTTLAQVLRKMRADKKGQPLRLIFMNPSHEHVDVFREEGWSRRYHGSIGGMPFVYAECPQ